MWQYADCTTQEIFATLAEKNLEIKNGFQIDDFKGGWKPSKDLINLPFYDKHMHFA